VTDTTWPDPPAEAVFHGPAREFVLRTDPHTESHPMAMLSQFLVAFGTAAGAGAHYAVEASRHHSNEFIAVSNLFSRNKKAREIHRALQALIDAGRLERAAVRDPRSDRSLTVWRPASEPAATRA
jgi:hypothetical protein